MNNECIKDKIQDSLNSVLTRVAVLESSQNTVREDLKSVKDDVKLINAEIGKINKTIEDKFTALDKKQIEDLKTNKSLVWGIAISIITGLAVPLILFFMGGN